MCPLAVLTASGSSCRLHLLPVSWRCRSLPVLLPPQELRPVSSLPCLPVLTAVGIELLQEQEGCACASWVEPVPAWVAQRVLVVMKYKAYIINLPACSSALLCNAKDYCGSPALAPSAGALPVCRLTPLCRGFGACGVWLFLLSVAGLIMLSPQGVNSIINYPYRYL